MSDLHPLVGEVVGPPDAFTIEDFDTNDTSVSPQIKQRPSTRSTSLGSVLSNPTALSQLLNITPKQAKNIKSIVSGAGASIGHKMLADLIGDELAAGVGGALAAHLSKRLLGGKQ